MCDSSVYLVRLVSKRVAFGQVDELLHQSSDAIRKNTRVKLGGRFEVPIAHEQAQAKADVTRTVKELMLDENVSSS
jgi:hypothetical protein